MRESDEKRCRDVESRMRREEVDVKTEREGSESERSET
jgi:hypothetical protein